MQLARENKLWMIRSSLLNLDLVRRKIGRNVATNQLLSVSVIIRHLPGAYVSMYRTRVSYVCTYDGCAFGEQEIRSILDLGGGSHFSNDFGKFVYNITFVAKIWSGILLL